jgi:ParB family chromosome partitioning protein
VPTPATATAAENNASTIKGAASGRADLWRMDTDKLVIVTDKGHPLYDERVALRVPDWLIESVIEHGVLQPVVLRRNGHLFEVQDGRQRVRAVIAANQRLLEKGSDRVIQVPCVLRKDDDQSAAKIMVAINEQRQADTPIVRAKKAQRMLEVQGIPKPEVARQFAISVPMLDELLRLLEASPEVQEMVESGQVALTAASRLVALPRNEQKAAMEEIKAAGMAVTRQSASKKVANKTEARKSGQAERELNLAPSKRLLAKVRDAYAEDDRQTQQAMAQLLTWVLTGEKARMVPGAKPNETLHAVLKALDTK